MSDDDVSVTTASTRVVGVLSDESPLRPINSIDNGGISGIVNHMSYEVSPAKFVTCICGKVCKGRAAFANHARKCPQEVARSEAFIARIEGRA